MIIQVVPIKRLPCQIQAFDYEVPDELQDQVEVGQLVIIPLRKSDNLGLLLNIQKRKINKKNKALKHRSTRLLKLKH